MNDYELPYLPIYIYVPIGSCWSCSFTTSNLPSKLWTRHIPGILQTCGTNQTVQSTSLSLALALSSSVDENSTKDLEDRALLLCFNLPPKSSIWQEIKSTTLLNSEILLYIYMLFINLIYIIYGWIVFSDRECWLNYQCSPSLQSSIMCLWVFRRINGELVF